MAQANKAKTDHKTNKAENTKLRVFLTIALGCASVFLFYYLLGQIQNSIEDRQIYHEMKKVVQDLKKTYKEEDLPFDFLAEATNELYREDISLICCLAGIDPDFEISDEYLKHVDPTGVFLDIRILDRKGNVLASSTDEPLNMDAAMMDALEKAFESGEAVPCSAGKGEDDQSAANLSSEDEDGTLVTAGQLDNIWYIKTFDKEHAYACLAVDPFLSSLMSYANVWSMLMENNEVGDSGFTFAWSDQTGDILYYPDEEKRNQTILAVGLNPGTIKDSGYSWQELNGKKMYVYASLLEEEGVWIASAVSEEELGGASRFIRIVLTVVFALLCALLVYYAVLLLRLKKVRVLTDFTHSGAVVAHRSRKQKLLILTAAIVVALFLFLMYLQTLYLMSMWASSASMQTERIENSINQQEMFTKTFIASYDDHKQRQLAILEGYLSRENDNAVDTSDLDEISYAVEAFRIQILDTEGNILTETSSMSYPSLLEKEMAEDVSSPSEAVALQDNTKKTPSEWMSEGRRVLLPVHDASGAVNRYLYVQYYSIVMDFALQQFSLEKTMSLIRPGKGGFVFSVDMDTKKFDSFPGGDLEGRDALEYGLTEKQLKDNYCDYIQVDGASYYAVSDLIGRHLIYYAIAKRDLFKTRFLVSILSAICAMTLLLMTGLGLYTSKEQIELVQPDEGRHLVEAEKNSPESKVVRVIVYYLLGSAAVFAGYSSFLASMNSDGILGVVLGGRWEHGFNAFALTSAVLILCRGGFILFFASKFVHVLGDILPVRGGTILKMVGSLVTYVSVAVLLYQCAICFGLNPTALMASAGIVSVVLGIGANSLVGDILAGIFLMMEGNVQVGDVVQVGNFRGYVMDLGIRMTKLFDMDSDDVKIIPNNEVRNVVHMTMRASIVYSQFQIRYEEHLESVEKILREELKKVPHKSPLILSGPVYIGVEALDENGVILKTATRCHESSRRKVEREVNHIVYSIFQKNNISVPYPQVTMHMGDDEMVERDET